MIIATMLTLLYGKLSMIKEMYLFPKGFVYSVLHVVEENNISNFKIWKNFI